MKSKTKNALISQFGSKTIIEKLSPFITDRRKERIVQVIQARLNSIQLAIESPSDINNALATIRTSEVLGVSTVHLISPEGDAKYIRSITQGAFYWTNLEYHDSLEDFIAIMRDKSFLLAGSLLNSDTHLNAISVDKPLCLLLGNEQRGLSAQAIAACDLTYSIPMYGMSESLNLSVSAAISLYEITTRRRSQINSIGDLNQEQHLESQANYYLNSVNYRLIDTLLKK